MQWAAIGLLSLLIFTLPSLAFAETFNGLVYNAPPYQNDVQLEYDVNLLNSLTKTVKLYDNTEMESIVDSLEEKNLDVLIGFDMGKINSSGPNITKVKLDLIDPYIQIAKINSNVKAIILEKDPIVYMSEERIMGIADYIESQGVSVGVAMAPDNWIKTPNLADHVSIVYVYAFDYWNGSSGFDAAENARNLYNDYLKKYSNNEVIFEFGFPTDGNTIGHITPTLDEQQTFIDQITISGINYIFFSLTDDKNKMFKLGFENNDAEYHWGLYTEDRGDKQSRIINVDSAGPTLIVADTDNSKTKSNVLRIDVFASEPTGIILIDGEDRTDFYVNEYLKIFYESNNGYENVSIVSQIENAV